MSEIIEIKQQPNVVSETKKQLFDLGSVTLCVLLFYLSFPGGSMPWLAWFAFVPLGLALHKKSCRDSFMLAFTASLFCWMAAIWWIVPAVSRIANSNYSVVVPFYLLFCLVYAIPYGIAATLYSQMKWTSSICGAFKGALLWTAVHGLSPHILPGNIAHSQYLNLKIIQLVELSGISLLLFMMYLFTFLIVTAFVNLPKKSSYAATAFVSAILIPFLIISFGQWRLNELNEIIKQPATKKFTAGIVQPNIPIDFRDRADWESEIGKMNTLSKNLLEKTPNLDLLTWPEIPPPISYQQYHLDKTIIDKLIGIKGTPMLVAGLHFDHHKSCKDCYYNVTEFITPEGMSGSYRKMRLLPFAEYLPFEQEFSWLRKIFPNALNYLPGETNEVFSLSQDFNLLPLICYESLFPQLVAEGVEKGANIIINPVNDAWFGDTSGTDIHLALAIFRSVEFRMPLIRTANSGISALVDVSGEIIPETLTSVLAEWAVSGSVSVVDIETPFQKFGDSFLWLAVILSIFFLIRDKTALGTFQVVEISSLFKANG